MLIYELLKDGYIKKMDQIDQLHMSKIQICRSMKSNMFF
jgi:hypothetical protein